MSFQIIWLSSICGTQKDVYKKADTLFSNGVNDRKSIKMIKMIESITIV